MAAGLLSQLCQAQAGSPSTESPGHLEASPRGVPPAYTPALSVSYLESREPSVLPWLGGVIPLRDIEKAGF